MIYDDIGSVKAALASIWWWWVSMERYWLMVLGQQKAVPVGTWWYWVRRRRYWLIHDGTGSVWGSTCWNLVVLD